MKFLCVVLLFVTSEFAFTVQDGSLFLQSKN